jgi:hypothetical protein
VPVISASARAKDAPTADSARYERISSVNIIRKVFPRSPTMPDGDIIWLSGKLPI